MRFPWQRKREAPSYAEAQPAAVQYNVELEPAPDGHTVEQGSLPTVSVDQLAAGGVVENPNERGAQRWGVMDGEKFVGGYGPTELLTTDYWTLRQRSDTLFRQNIYARGLLRRLITNEINTGLTLEAFPDEDILGFGEDELTGWSEDVEQRFHLWGKNPKLVDYYEQQTFAELQQTARLESLIGGDVLVVERQNPRTQLPQIQLINGQRVRTPYDLRPDRLRKGHQIIQGVELDARGRHVAFWISHGHDRKSERIPAFGPRTGRKMAWLIYGTDKRRDDVRGEPMLGIIMQSLKEIDRYRDSAQRKATVNSMVAAAVEKSQEKMGSRPLTAGATRKDQFTQDHEVESPRNFTIQGQIPGLVVEELQVGEELKVHQSGAEINFGPFESAIVQAIAWSHEIPPEILWLAFSNNYSASQAAINEFKMYLNKIRTTFGQAFCQPIYVDWLLSETLLQRIRAPGLLQAWRDPAQYDVFGAWVESDWSGAIKPSTDLVKQTNGMEKAVKNGWTTNARASREIFGQSFRRVAKRLRRENEMLVEARRPLADFEQEYAETPSASTSAGSVPGEISADLADYIDGQIDEKLEDVDSSSQDGGE